MLRELQRMREAAERQGEMSEQLKRRARELADTMSPEEREALERWAEAQRREQQPGGDGMGPQPPGDAASPGEERGITRGDRSNSPEAGRAPGTDGATSRESTFGTDGKPTRIDANDDAPAGTKVGELPGDDEFLPGDIDPARIAQQNLAARKAAERAIEQGEVPARYHRFIQRYFRQFGPSPRGK